MFPLLQQVNNRSIWWRWYPNIKLQKWLTNWDMIWSATNTFICKVGLVKHSQSKSSTAVFPCLLGQIFANVPQSDGRLSWPAKTLVIFSIFREDSGFNNERLTLPVIFSIWLLARTSFSTRVLCYDINNIARHIVQANINSRACYYEGKKMHISYTSTW